MTAFANSRPFVVACPACGGWCSVSDAMAGAAACCPLCAAAFRVPAPPHHAPAPPQPVPGSMTMPAAPAPAADIAVAVALAADPPPTFEVPDHVLAAAAPVADLQFCEPPPKTISHGGQVIELRRLTPEEKEARRRRRNLIILMTGAAILIA
ncbi:MAG: hypothetical protein ACKONH_02395, partial [Planctomycetia bacterium]